MTALTYRISVLGCRVNHAEARELESILISRGIRRASTNSPADIEVIHTCSVTNSAATKSRQAARRAGRRISGENPAAAAQAGVGQRHAEQESSPHTISSDRRVFVTGCYASTNPDEAASLSGSAQIIPQSAGDESTMTQRFEVGLDSWLARRQHRSESIRSQTPPGCTQVSGDQRLRHLPVIATQPGAGGHIRAELRIQDGCDAHCTFCIIPRIRPTLRSKRIDDAVREAGVLVDQGHQEIVLSGIFIGAYGHETALRRRQQYPQAHPLADLLDAIAQVPGLQRLRISSMEPGDVTAALLDAMVANQPIVVPHLHLPLQSGSDRILKRMNRQYSVGDYLEMIEQVNERLTPTTPDQRGLPPAITTDIICGFPGESETDFDQTIAIARQAGYLHMHCFPFSPKQGTAAARWRDQFVPEHIRKQRVRQLIEIESNPQHGLAVQYHQRMIGRTVRVMIEGPDDTQAGCMIGRTDHYARASVPTTATRGTLLEAIVVDADAGGLVAQQAPARVALPIMT